MGARPDKQPGRANPRTPRTGMKPLCKILIVEDSIVSAMIMEAAINRKQPDYAVRIRKSLKGGLESKRELQPDLVILDLSLPDTKSPDETLDAIPLFAEGGTKVLVVSGFVELQDEAMRRGASDFMPKGIGENAQPFMDRINALIPQC